MPGWFDGDWYRDANPDVGDAQSDPFTHYLGQGRSQGLAPNSALHHLDALVRPALLSNADEDHAVAVIVDSSVFDVDWYTERHAMPQDEAVRHYVSTGAFRGLDPNPFFSSFDYLKANADVAMSGGNPLVHYIVFGFLEGREVSLTPTLQRHLTARIWLKGF